MYPIPANATRIRYLESTGTQYVNTGITIKSGLGFRAAFDMPANNKGTVFGARNSDKSVRCLVWLGGSSTGANNFRYDYGNGSTASNRNKLTGTRAIAQVDDNVVVFTDVASGQIIPTTPALSAQTFSANLNIFVFGMNHGGGISDRPAGCKCYYLKILDGGTLVRDFVPVRVGTVGYLFDRVSGQLFGNAAASGAGFASECCGPDTFQQGVVPTRMMAMGIRKEAQKVQKVRLYDDGTFGHVFDIRTGYPLTAGAEVTGTVDGNSRSGTLDSNLSAVFGDGGYVGEFADTTPGQGGPRWFDLGVGDILSGNCEIIEE